MTLNNKIKFMQGNEAVVEGAIAVGARFYAGYPITPSSEIAERSAIRLPQVGGLYVQMEDEIGSIAAIIGASLAGKKSYTATSGPGIALMSENIGVAVAGEVPCVLINVQRSGPSTGLATKPSQADVMQAKWSSHGDYDIIVLSPSSVQDCYDLTVEAFNLAEKYRTPVMFLSDAIVGHLREKVVMRDLLSEEIINRKQPTCNPKDYLPFKFDNQENNVAPLATYGSEYVFRVTTTTHDEKGMPNSTPENANKFIRHYTDKIEDNREDITIVRKYNLEDAEIAIITFGCVTRAALEAVKIARSKGIKLGLLQLVTIWPFADTEVRKVLKSVKSVIVPEMNLGQVIWEIKKVNDYGVSIEGVNRVDGLMITPDEILDKVKEVE